MDKGKKRRRIAVSIAFFAYLAVMLYLLFFQRMGGDSYMGYWERVAASTNFIPFHTIALFWANLSSDRGYIVQDAFKNLAGNIVLFIPIGWFLPFYWEKQRKFHWFLLTVILLISLVEAIQLFTLLGACDVDDLIFNTIGATVGFLFFAIFRRILIKRGKISS